jgi:hypothetical protein
MAAEYLFSYYLRVLFFLSSFFLKACIFIADKKSSYFHFEKRPKANQLGAGGSCM